MCAIARAGAAWGAISKKSSRAARHSSPITSPRTEQNSGGGAHAGRHAGPGTDRTLERQGKRAESPVLRPPHRTRVPVNAVPAGDAARPPTGSGVESVRRAHRRQELQRLVARIARSSVDGGRGFPAAGCRVCDALLIAQRRNRVHPRGAPRRPEAGEDPRGEQKHRHRDK